MNEQVKARDCPICNGSGDPERTLNNTLLRRCSHCDFVFADISVDSALKSNSSLDEDVHTHYESQQSILDQAFYQGIVDSISRHSTCKNAPATVLDVGCGHGKLLQRFMLAGFSCTGIDSSPYAVSAAQRIGFDLKRGFIESDILPENCFDSVVSTSTFEHIPEPRRHLFSVLRVLRPGGLAIFTGMPNYDSLPIRLGCSTFAHNTPPNHVNYFTVKTLSQLLGSAGIAEAVKDVSIHSYGIPGAWDVYSWILKSGRKILRRNPAINSPVRSLHPSPASESIRAPALSPWSRAAVWMYLAAGRPFSTGASLYLTFQKR